MKKIKLKNASAVKESVAAVAPITIIILLVNFFLLPQKLGTYDLIGFLFGNVLLVLGMVLYGKGIKMSLEPIGEKFGAFVTSKKKVWILLLVGALLGFIVTVAEPDLNVLGEQLGNLKTTIIITISLGVGVFLAIALLKTMLGWDFNLLILILYALVFLAALLVENKYIPLCFDSGGVTTGALTVPFLLSFGASVAGMAGGKNKEGNSFGMVAICSIGPILMMLLLCAFTRPEVNTAISHNSSLNFSELVQSYLTTAGAQFKEVLIALTPITVIFFIFNFASFKLPAIQLFRILFGFLYTYIGLSIFLTGVNAAYMGTGYFIGQSLASSDKKWMLMPIGAVVATFIILAEPAVGVLTKQVEEISAGAIKKHTILIALALSMAFALAFSMFRILYGISIWWVLGIGYAVALGMSFLVPRVFTSIAFDSGGVASGPMTATFLLPFAIGAAEQIQGADGILTSAYGLVATVALMPLITIQFIGLLSQLKQKRFNKKRLKVIDDDEIIELNVN